MLRTSVTFPALIFVLTIVAFVLLSGAELFIGLTIRDQSKKPKERKPATIQVKLVVTAFFAGLAAWIILSQRYDASGNDFAYTTVGTILGFWLRGSK